MSEFNRKIGKTETAFSVRNNPTILDLMLTFFNIPSHTHVPPSSMQHVICECAACYCEFVNASLLTFGFPNDWEVFNHISPVVFPYFRGTLRYVACFSQIIFNIAVVFFSAILFLV